MKNFRPGLCLRQSLFEALTEAVRFMEMVGQAVHRPTLNKARAAIAKATAGRRLDEAEIVRLFSARDADYQRVTTAAEP